MSISSEQLARAKALVKKHGSVRKAAAAIGVPKSTLSDWLQGGKAQSAFIVKRAPVPPPDGSPRRHLIIPDTQVRPGVPLDHLHWIGQAIVEYHPDVIVHLGDHWDFPSLNSHEKPGSLPLEGLRYADDVKVGNNGFARICAPMEIEQHKLKWRPEKHYIMGNHDIRPDRVASNDPKLLGSIGSDQCDTRDWQRHPYLEIVRVDGILYSHFFQSSHSDRPIGGTIPNKLSKIGSSMVHGHVQGLDMGTKMMGNGLTLWGISAGSCLTPDHKVLTADLKYIPLGDITVGQELVSFDEHCGRGEEGRSRRYKKGTVQAISRDFDDLFLVTLDNGKTFKVTKDHLWLTRKAASAKWMRTDQLISRDMGHWGATHVPILLDEWETGTTFDHGWLSGLYDGEGCIYHRETTGGLCTQLTIAQKPGPVLDRAKEILHCVAGVEGYTSTNQRGVSSLYLKGGRANIAKVLGILRPVRLLPKFTPDAMGRMNISRWTGIKSIEPLGRGEIVRVAIDAKTMIVEGYGHHNCYLHEEDYRGAQGQRHFRGIIILNETRGGECCPMILSLDYLCRRYEDKSLYNYMCDKYKGQSWEHLR